MPYYHSSNEISYPISKLSAATIDYNTLIELIDDKYGNGEFISKQSTIRMLGHYFVSSYSIFNVLDDVFNDHTIDVIEDGGATIHPYLSDVYFPSAVYFFNNPYTKDVTSQTSNLLANQTVSKRQLLNYVQQNGFEIDPIKSHYVYWEYVNEENNGHWEITDGPVYSDYTLQSKYGSQTNEFSRLNEVFYATNEVVVDKNTFLTIIGKVGLPDGYTNDRVGYYTPEYNLWAAVYENGKILNMTEIHNIDENGVGYFSMQLPIAGNEKIRVIVPFEPKEITATHDDSDLFSDISVNTVCFNYQYINIYDSSYNSGIVKYVNKEPAN